MLFPPRLSCNLLLRRRLLCLLTHRGPFSTNAVAASSPLHVPLSHPAYFIWSANTSLGKTVVSTGLAYSFLGSSPSKFLYLKPLQTGFPSDCDSRFILNKISSLFSRRYAEVPSLSLVASRSVLRSSVPAAKSLLGGDFELKKNGHALYDLDFHEKRLVGEGSKSSEMVCQTLYAWKEAVSPHLVAEREGGALENQAVVNMLANCLTMGLEGDAAGERSFLGVIETAGGVASPGPSGSLQCDLYRYVAL